MPGHENGAKRTSGGGGAWRAYVREAIHGQQGTLDLKVVGQLYNKLFNVEMPRLKVTGFFGTMAHKPHKKALGLAESNIARELDRRGEVAALAELRLHDDDAHVNDQQTRWSVSLQEKSTQNSCENLLFDEYELLESYSTRRWRRGARYCLPSRRESLSHRRSAPRCAQNGSRPVAQEGPTAQPQRSPP